MSTPEQAVPTRAAVTRSDRPDLWALVLPAVLLTVAGAVIIHAARGTTFFFDEWVWIVQRHSPSTTSLLEPFNNHLMAVPIATYQVMMRVVGLGSPVPYRLVLLLGHLLTCALLYVYLRRRIASPAALAGTALLAFFGYAWAVIIWPISIGWVIATAAGIGALLLVDRDSRRADLGAALALTLGIASSGIAVPFVAGLAVEMVVRRGWRRMWVPLVPLAIFGTWYLGYATRTSDGGSVGDTVSFAEKLLAQTVGTLVGIDDRGTAAHVVLAIVGAGLVVLWLALGRPHGPRLIGNAAALAAFVGLLSISRAGSGLTTWHSYAAAVFVLLTLGELVRDRDLGKIAIVGIALVAVWSVVWNIGQLDDGADLQRTRAQETRAQLAAAEAGGAHLDPAARTGDLLLEVRNGPYLEVAERFGSPAYSPAEMRSAPAFARRAADDTLVRGLGLALAPAAPAPAASTGSTDGCAIALPDQPAVLKFELLGDPPASSVLVEADGVPATVSIRIYGDRWTPLGRVVAGSPAVLTVPSLPGAPGWSVQVTSLDHASVCFETDGGWKQ